MCQMCDEYENELRRMGLVVEAGKARSGRGPGGKPDTPVAADPPRADTVGLPGNRA